MLNARIPAMRNQAWIGAALFAFAIWLAWQAGGKIVAGDMRTIEFAAFGCAGCVVAVAILRNWRTGFYFFFVWLMFEDLVRKYLGNGTALFFGKDALACLVYISLFVAVRRGKEKIFRPPFLLPLGLFAWLGVMQIFNQNSPSVLYGLLGFKLDFFYIPLIFVGYALIRHDEDLRKFLVINAVLAGIIASLGIVQAILGNSFLNPANLAPELQDLGDLYKVAPISGQILSLPDSVFVSSGRFALYLGVSTILVLGAAGYLLLYTKRNRKLVYLVAAILGAATLFSGSRGAMVYGVATALILTVGFLWGAPWRWGQAHRIVKAIRRSFIVGALGLTAVLLLFPTEAGSRMALYTETLNPNSNTYEAGYRAWSYPIQNLMEVFAERHWVMGEGIGTASLGTQYVSKMLGQPPPGIWVEEGYGVLIAEMGIIAPFLWILWTAALLFYSWKIVRGLRETRFFPIAFAIFWYAFLLLYPYTFGGLSAYQNYINNVYLWLLIGILFRLPNILAAPQPPVAVSSPRWRARAGFQF